ncbi:Similar to Demethylmenaquinone methyltransferase; acc. no. Q72HI4 [Pyronema omphalodes CBS 100304]|uniref:Similar to Demethylmenaquinone methyltransferase acc. no. Q72HI4 n=1 Tax=Pyronema omphalodes (strain CBS 100304) TaxID=1076935 RepID=U4L2U3_PYROM|nr:Similar to Demethylmenaquinone methyltransferase; acc. no. Q72HI4 [Pyronema omphalodes CBS 100304]
MSAPEIEVDPSPAQLPVPINADGIDNQTFSLQQDVSISYHDDSGYQTSTLSLNSLINQMDLHHEIFRLLLNEKLHLAPLDAPRKVLDIGTGTGIWAIDFADSYPSAEVIGTDISPIQPVYVPPNLKFEVDDAEADWVYASDYFDFIHSRNIAQCISDWEKLMGQIYRCTKPGGYVELSELGCVAFSDDETMAEDNAYKKCCELLNKTMETINRPWPVAGTLKARLEKAGFVDVHEVRFKQPVGPWPKDKRLKQVGAMVMLTSETGIEAYALAAFTRYLTLSVEEATKVIEDAAKALKKKHSHMYTDFYVAYGRKPQ